MRGIDEKLTGTGESMAADGAPRGGVNGGRAARARFRPGERGSELEEAGGGGGRGEGAVGARNRGTAAEVGRGTGGGAALLCSCARKKRRKRGTRQRGRIRPAMAAADKDARTQNEDRRRVFQGWTPAKPTRGTPRCVLCTPRQRNGGPSWPHTKLSGPPNLGS